MTILDTIQHRLGKELTAMNDIITDTLHTANPMMNDVVDNYLRTKGKQIRPIIVMLSAKMLGKINSHVLYAAAALEMLHNASLIHDDVVDETKTRRGKATINSIWGNHVAVLVGDYFVSNALAVGIKTESVHVVKALSDLGVELSTGEVDQISNARAHHYSEEAYFNMIRKKTASLFMHCMKIGAETSGATKDYWSPMVRYAELLGLCFQIRDDIFDYFPAGEIGKPTGNDLREGKVTLPLLYALTHTTTDEAKSMRALLDKEQLNEQEIQTLINFAVTNGGIDYAYATMRDMQIEANEIINRYPDSDAKECFNMIFEFIISRNK
jgi:octaprenyl-diphosphate synthase